MPDSIEVLKVVLNQGLPRVRREGFFMAPKSLKPVSPRINPVRSLVYLVSQTYWVRQGDGRLGLALGFLEACFT
jgi:hypothetical protein